MDFIWMSTLRHSRNKKFLVIYDIMCQWIKNVFTCIKGLPDDIVIPLSPEDLQVAINKFHLLAHGTSCIAYSLNYLPGVGRIDGEGLERCWSVLNGIARSTREMGPGSRRDTINDHCGHSNWRKIVGMGSYIHLPCLFCKSNSYQQAMRCAVGWQLLFYVLQTTTSRSAHWMKACAA